MDWLFLYWHKSLMIFPLFHPLINLNKIITPKTTRSTTQKSSQFCQNFRINWIMIDSVLEWKKTTTEALIITPHSSRRLAWNEGQILL